MVLNMRAASLLRTLLFCLLAATPGRAAPPDTLSGRVSDPRGGPVAGAQVALVELARATASGADGRFVFASVPPGRYTVTVRRLGYGAASASVVVPVGAPLEVALHPAPTLVDPITVTATRSPLDRRASPLPADVLGGEPLRRGSTVSLARALEELPGVRSFSSGPQIGKPVVRGLSGARVLVLDDGHRLEDYSWSDEDGPSADARLAERVEVIRGPASLLYGSDAIGGVVNVIPHALPDAPAGSSLRRADVEVYGATNNTELGTAVRLDAARGDWSGRVFAIGRRAGDLHTPAGALDNTGFAAVNGEAALGVHGSRGSATLRFARYGGEFQLLEAKGPEAGGGGPERKVADHRLQLTGTSRLGGLRLEAKGQWQRHAVAEVSDTGAVPGSEATVIDLLLDTYTLDLLAHNSIAGRATATVGVSGSYQTNVTRGPVPLVPGARTATGALFAVEQLPLGRWSLLAGARVDVRRLEADSNAALALGAETRDYTAYSGDVGVVWRLAGGLSLVANLGRAWRAPDLFELFANGPRLDEARYDRGDATLVPETSWNVDAGVRWQGRSASGELAAYRNRIDNFIFVAPTDQFINALRVYRYFQEPATLWGGEGAFDLQPLAVLSLRGQADYVHGADDRTRRPLPLMPPLRATLEAELHWRRGDGGNSYAGMETELVARQTRLASDSIPGQGFVTVDIPTAAYGLLHLAAGLERRLGGRQLRLDLRVRNATNARYRDYLNRYKEFALDAGRNLVLRVGSEF